MKIKKIKLSGVEKVLFGFLSGLVVLCLFLCVYIILMRAYFTRRIDILEEENKAFFMESFQRLDEITLSVQDGNSKLSKRIGVTDLRVQKINKVYGDVLIEQKKRTIDDVYPEEQLKAMMQTGIEYLHKQKYAQARESFMEICKFAPDNLEARFYATQALFLLNRLDRSQYAIIQKEFQILKENGFTKPEMEDILNYIANENDALKINKVAD
jgi:hypothetical protein